jgi:hypothetical protein
MKNISQIAQKCSEGNTGTSEQKKNRRYVFTSFNETEPTLTTKMKYILYAPEICPGKGTFHWQGYVEWKSQRTISAIQREYKKLKLPFGKLLIAQGDIGHQLDYIRGPYNKDGKTKPYNPDWKEFGKRPKGQGHRTDLVELKNTIMNGKKVDDIVIENPIAFHQYGRTLERIEDIYLCKQWRKEMTKGIWYYGPTGTGKSHEAFKNYNPDTHYLWVKDGRFQDGYRGQPIVIMNDFRGHIPYDDMLNIVDKHPYFVNRKGRRPIPFISKTVIVTSPLTPDEVYHNRRDKDDLEQFSRRFTVIEKKTRYIDLAEVE